MIPILVFISLFGIMGLMKMEQFSSAILFSDLEKNDYFFDRYISVANSRIQAMFWLQSEEHIRNMGCLKWQAREETNYDQNGNPVTEERFNLISTVEEEHWYHSNDTVSDIDSHSAKSLVDNAIREQLADFSSAKRQLAEMPGLYFYVTNGERGLGNVSGETGAAFFRTQPVYYISEVGEPVEQSRTTETRNSSSGYYMDNWYVNNYASVYIAFTDDMVNYQNNTWRISQHQLIKNLVVTLVPLLALAALFIILLCGAGRKQGCDRRELHLMTPDKLWLDLGLGLLVLYEFILCYFVYYSMEYAWSYNNMRWIYTLCAVLSIFFMLPLTGWIMSAAKHIKAGKWWRHTLVYLLIKGIIDALRRFIKSLWAGFSLTMRVALIGCVLLITYAFLILLDYAAFALILSCLFTAATVFILLRYSRKIYLVEQGARGASNGQYDTPILATGGELGSIAASINNISDGINAAVSERMKSERLKTELITNVSHDIRTPLTSLITYTDLLKSEGLASERATEYLDVLIQKTARLKTLTDDLFSAAKALSGNIEVHLENLDLVDFVRQVLGEMDEKVHESGLDFRLNLPDHAPVQADGKLMWRVMENLLSNTFKYALAGSRVYLDITAEDIWYRLDLKNISDRPLNVDPSELIERFKRGDDARSGDGSGLGLSIAQSFILSQGGRFALAIDGDLFKASLHLPKR